MYALMSYQMALMTECHITHRTGIWALTTMYALMSYQMTLFTECLVTHFTQMWTHKLISITGISAFNSVYIKLSIQGTLVKTQRYNIRIYSNRKNIF
jgi:hypothetical protein